MAKLILAGVISSALAVVAWYFLTPLYRFYYTPEELEPYDIRPRHNDDTLRIALIGDSWADYHTALSGDTIIAHAARKIYRRPVKATTRGKRGALSKEIYFFMFSSKTEEHSYEPDRCTQPLIEEHPDYCVLFAGINDVTYRRTTAYYAENLRLMIRLLLHNGIRPVVMEIPRVDFEEPMGRTTLRERLFYMLRSTVMGTSDCRVEDYQEALREMLDRTQLRDSVLYIAAQQWNPRGATDTSMFLEDRLHLNLEGYHRLDSCIVAEVVRDYISRR